MKQIALLATLIAVPAFTLGAALTGELDLSGASGQNVAVGPCSSNMSNFCIDFDWTGTTSGGTPQTVMTGTVDGSGGNAAFNITNNFSTVNGGTSTQAIVTDLNSASDTPGSTVSDAGFVTFNLNPTWSVTLTEVVAGSDPSTMAACLGPLSNGQTCTPAGTPFNEQNQCTGTTASTCTVDINFQFIGTATNGSATSSVIGKFSTTFSGTDYQIINTDIGQGLDVVTSDSGTLFFTPVSGVPEPMTSALVGAGLIVLGLLKRKARQTRP